MKSFSQFISEERVSRETYEKFKQLAKKLELEHKGLTLVIGTDQNAIAINSIVVPKEERKSGLGTKVMEEVCAYADKLGATLSLTPSKDFGATSIDRLRKFYGKFGFVRNMGRKKDYEISNAMYRTPK